MSVAAWGWLAAGSVLLLILLFLEFTPPAYTAPIAGVLGIPLFFRFPGRRYYIGAVVVLVTLLLTLRGWVEFWTP
ncbi:MAG: hypothetical protein HY042_02715 [Spirochaetia bacterium]|nr:hypothetical protein [Spirochaetia bacterium]